MWEFIVLLFSFFLGLFTIAQAYGSLLYGIPEANKEKAELAKKGFVLTILIHILIALILSLIVFLTVLKNYSWCFIIGYFIIPFIVTICRRDDFLFEARKRIKEIKEENTKIFKENEFYSDEKLKIFLEVEKIKNGREGFFSEYDIVLFMIDLEEYKRDVDEEHFKQLKELYSKYMTEDKYKIKKRYDFFSLMEQSQKIDDEFEEVAYGEIEQKTKGEIVVETPLKKEVNKIQEKYENALIMQEKVKKLYAGGVVKLSKADLVMMAINLQDLKKIASPKNFEKIMKRYNEYVEDEFYKEEMLYNLHSFIKEMMPIQEEFNQLAFLDEEIDNQEEGE